MMRDWGNPKKHPDCIRIPVQYPLWPEPDLLNGVHEVDFVVPVVNVHRPVLTIRVDDLGQVGPGEDHGVVLQWRFRQEQSDDDQVALETTTTSTESVGFTIVYN